MILGGSLTLKSKANLFPGDLCIDKKGFINISKLMYTQFTNDSFIELANDLVLSQS